MSNSLSLPGPIPRRPLGSTGEMVSVIGIGGGHVGGKSLSPEESVRLIRIALDHGINFLDNAWDYNYGESERRMGLALEDGYRDKAFLMTKVCTHGRGKKVAMEMLEEQLRRLRTDHLDLWQIHEVVFDNEPELAYAAGGVIEALVEAKEQGKVRYVGFTGHKSPWHHHEMLRRGFAFDTAMMPLNVMDFHFRSFEREVVPVLAERGIGVIGMKSQCGGRIAEAGTVSPEEAIRYTIGIPELATLVSGISSFEHLQQNAAAACLPMAQDERAALRERARPTAVDGRLELYKIGIQFEGWATREQHGLPAPGTPC
ncbi:MAG: Ferredoxin [Armatimonadetes bacterium]|jgi:aryl-alcohol dehydrogenase-like predicted oxidoreductase|nr:Ferredoxin [Armatimonadota bacterium]